MLLLPEPAMPDVVITTFALGLCAGLIRSDLRVPKGATDLISILLLFAIGLKGGMALAATPVQWPTLLPQMLAVVAMGFAIPLLLAPVLRHLVKLSGVDAASVAAHYGSVSVGTFAVALAFVDNLNLDYEAQLTLFVVLLEMPAIAVGILLARRAQGQTGGDWGKLAHEVLASKGMLLLGSGVLIGALYGEQGLAPIAPLFLDLFKGWLALFLLEMGLCAAGALPDLKREHWRLALFAVVVPPLLALASLPLALAMGLSLGGSVLLMTLVASCSYIAAPAAMRMAVPEANLGLAIAASLAVTFPFNTLVGIPLYHQLALWAQS